MKATRNSTLLPAIGCRRGSLTSGRISFAPLTRSGAAWSVYGTLGVAYCPKRSPNSNRNCDTSGFCGAGATPFSLIYIFENRGEPLFQRGYASRAIAREEAKKLPDDFLDLYKIHDGWTDIHGFMGPLPSEDWFYLSNLVEEEFSEFLPGVRTSDFLIVCNSGGSKFLGFDLSKVPPLGLICSTIDRVEMVPDIVRTLDEWMAVDLRDLPNR